MNFGRLLEKVTGSEIALERVELKTLGLNHLSWHRGLTVDGEDVWPRLMQAYLEELRSDADPKWDAREVEALGMIPNNYLQYYYHTSQKLAVQQKWPPSRGEEVVEIEMGLLKQYADPALNEPPAELMLRGGAYYSTVATQLLNAHYNDLGEIHVVNICHDGVVPGWPEDWVLEMPAVVDRTGIHPIPTEPLPADCFDLLAQVKSYELLTADAAVRADREAAYQALLIHPLGPKPDQVQAVLEDLLVTNQKYLSPFFQQDIR